MDEKTERGEYGVTPVCQSNASSQPRRPRMTTAFAAGSANLPGEEDPRKLHTARYRRSVLRRREPRETSSIDSGASGGGLVIRPGETEEPRSAHTPAQRPQGAKAPAPPLNALPAIAHVCRVNTMGVFAVSIAHEVNQPLAAIVANGHACLRWLANLPGDSIAIQEARAALSRIIRDGNRAAEIIARTRSLVTNSTVAKSEFNIRDIVQELVAMIRSELSHRGVALNLALTPDLPPLTGDAVQIQQVMTNLVLNALEAMETVEAGRRNLSIATRHLDDGHICIEVQDSGIGLDPQQAEQVFDAFYTTKAGGIGMGLWISRSIIEDHGGTVCALSHDGPGVTFRITLPK